MTKASEGTISLVAVCDNNYIMLLATLLKSIEQNHKSNERIDCYIVEDNLSSKNKRKLISSFSNDFMHFHWFNVNEVLVDNVYSSADSTAYPLNIYVRLFIPYFLPLEVERAIYLDVDMIVTKDISTLWKVDIEDNIIGAVQDTFGTALHGIANHRELGIPPDAKYFNSGLLLIDTVKWRKCSITEALVSCLKQNRAHAKYPDQYGLNVVLTGRWYELDKRWNTYTYQEEGEPYLIHYIGYKPIYKDYDGRSEYFGIFYHYLNMTQWVGFRQQTKYHRYAAKFRTRIKKMLF